MNKGLTQDGAGGGAHWTPAPAGKSSTSLRGDILAVMFPRRWACKTDGLSHAHWIHSHPHLLALSCGAQHCMKPVENRVCSCKCWRGQRWSRPRRLTWGLIFPDYTSSLGLCSFSVYAKVHMFVLSLCGWLAATPAPLLHYLRTCSYSCGWRDCPWGR